MIRQSCSLAFVVAVLACTALGCTAFNRRPDMTDQGGGVDIAFDETDTQPADNRQIEATTEPVQVQFDP